MKELLIVVIPCIITNITLVILKYMELKQKKSECAKHSDK